MHSMTKCAREQPPFSGAEVPHPPLSPGGPSAIEKGGWVERARAQQARGISSALAARGKQRAEWTFRRRGAGRAASLWTLFWICDWEDRCEQYKTGICDFFARF